MKSIAKKIIRKVFGNRFFLRLQEYKSNISGDYGCYLHSNILLEKQKAVYFFIPKVACTSLKKACSDILGMDVADVHKYDFPYVKRYELNKYKNYFKFAFVRNPWDRLVSCYHNKILSEPITNKDYTDGVSNSLVKFKKFYSQMPFESFIKAVCLIPDGESDPHFRSQYMFITDKERKIMVDYVGRFENLENDFAHVLKVIHIDDYSLSHLNKTSRTDYRAYYNEQTKMMVAQRYDIDISLFDYHF